jgi:hypothetical protein
VIKTPHEKYHNAATRERFGICICDCADCKGTVNGQKVCTCEGCPCHNDWSEKPGQRMIEEEGKKL